MLIFKGYLYEARNLNLLSSYRNDHKKSNIRNESPLKDDEIVTVYHGIAYLRDVFKILNNGVDGKSPITRKDEYETQENPTGLFVTPSLKTAEYFANSGYIIEFNCKVSDLETPIWNKKDGDDVVNNRQAMKNSLRDKHSKSTIPFVKNSDRPELAYSFSRSIEPQALFTGTLKPNQIKAVWYEPIRDLSSNEYLEDREESWTRLSVNQAKSQLKKISENDRKTVNDIDSGLLPDGTKV